MWEVPSDKLKIQLPPEFHLMEDTELVYLYYGEAQIAVFSISGIDPAEIERKAKSFLEKIEWNKTAHGL